MEATAGAGLAIGAAGLLLALIWRWRTRRLVVRRLASVSARLEPQASEMLGRGGIEAALARLERAADAAGLRGTAQVMAAERLAESLELVGPAVIVCDEEGELVHRNGAADALLSDTAARALAGEVVDELLRDAVGGRAGERTIELFGPPRRTLVVTASPLSEGTREIGAVAVVEDVTTTRRLQAIRRDFVANVTAELRSPVGALGLLAETLAEEEDPVLVRRFAARIRTEAARVGRIVEDLVALTQIEAEEGPEREPHPVHLVVADALVRVRPLARDRSVTVEAGEAPRGLTVIGDRRQLSSALAALIENAVTHSPAGSVVQVGTWTDGEWVDLAVRDRGVGIPTRELDRIFERFYRVRGREERTGGAGLGLAIVRHVAGAHGGEVRVSSEEGVGSTFTLRLPAGPGPLVASEAS